MSDDFVCTHSLKAVDTLFFRDGRPFNQDDEGLSQASSMFPPTPATTFGALRAAYARAAGWSETDGNWAKGKFKKNIGKERAQFFDDLGDGVELGKLSALGPVLKQGMDFLFPAPSILAASKDHVELRRADPVTPDFQTDETGMERYCVIGGEKSDEFRQCQSSFLTHSGLEMLLSGQTPDKGSIKQADSVFERESRIGIQQDPSTGSAKEGMLFSAGHVRPNQVGKGACWQETELVIDWRIQGGADIWSGLELDTIAPIGGESRFVNVGTYETSISDILRDVSPPKLWASDPGFLGWKGKSVCRYLIILVTPLLIPTSGSALSVLGNLPGKCVSASTYKPMSIGGQVVGGGKDEKNGPRAAIRAFPAGSTFFFETDQGEEEIREKLTSLQCGGFGNENNYRMGFGMFVFGNWTIGGPE